MSLVLAVDFGGTKVASALVDQHGTVLPQSRFQSPTGRNRSSEEIAEGFRSIIAKSLASMPEAEVIGCGIGSAGPIDINRGVVSPFNTPVWKDYPLVDLVQSASGLPTTLRMDGQALVLAEHWVGAGQNVDNMMGMVVSTGVGGGLILGGKLITGASGNAGHIGHVLVPPDAGDSGGDPRFPTATALEATASGPYSVAWAQSQGWVGTSGEDLSRSAALGDTIALAAIRRSGRAVGKAIASATALLELELVVIAGGFSKVSPVLFDSIRGAIAEHHLEFVRRVRVEPSKLTDDAPLIGAAALVHLA
ncbi:MAG: ROK family protein [Microbacteriaceae bacterium]